jgi:hypothetical protein
MLYVLKSPKLHVRRLNIVPFRPVVPKVHSLDPKGAMNSSEVTRGYTSVMVTLKFAKLLITRITFFQK